MTRSRKNFDPAAKLHEHTDVRVIVTAISGDPVFTDDLLATMNIRDLESRLEQELHTGKGTAKKLALRLLHVDHTSTLGQLVGGSCWNSESEQLQLQAVQYAWSSTEQEQVEYVQKLINKTYKPSRRKEYCKCLHKLDKMAYRDNLPAELLSILQEDLQRLYLTCNDHELSQKAKWLLFRFSDEESLFEFAVRNPRISEDLLDNYACIRYLQELSQDALKRSLRSVLHAAAKSPEDQTSYVLKELLRLVDWQNVQQVEWDEFESKIRHVWQLMPTGQQGEFADMVWMAQTANQE